MPLRSTKPRPPNRILVPLFGVLFNCYGLRMMTHRFISVNGCLFNIHNRFVAFWRYILPTYEAPKLRKKPSQPQQPECRNRSLKYYFIYGLRKGKGLQLQQLCLRAHRFQRGFKSFWQNGRNYITNVAMAERILNWGCLQASSGGFNL